MDEPAADEGTAAALAKELVAPDNWDGNNNSSTEATGDDHVSSWRARFGVGADATSGANNADDEDADGGAHYTWKRAAPAPESDDEKDEGEDDAPRTSVNGRAVPSGIDDLPLFADDKNKALHGKIRGKERRFEAVKAEIDESASRVAIMSEHLKNVQQELLHTQELHRAKQRELASEEHMKQLAEREIGRVAQEMRRLDAECGDLEGKLGTLQNFLFKGNEAMDKFKLQMNWNQDEMEQWATAARQKEADTLALDKYRRADESKIKELTLEIEKLTQQLHSQRRRVEDEATETQAKQIELDKTAAAFRLLHDERQQLVQQWQSTIETMQRRDDEIAAASEQFALAKTALAHKKATLAQLTQRLKLQEQENHDAQQSIAAKERLQSKAQQELQAATARLQEFADQVEVLKHHLASAVTQLTQQRAGNAHKAQALEAMRHALETARARYKATQQALASCLSSTADAETLAQQAEQDLAAMESERKRLDKELALAKDQMFRKSQQLFALRQQEASLIAEIAGATAAAHNLQTKLKLLAQSALRQQELVYNGEFQIQQMERKVARASGERSADETKLLTSQISVLQMELDRVKAEESMLSAQCKKLEDEKRSAERVQRALVAQRDEVAKKIADVELANESLASALKATTKEKEELLVQHDLQALEVQRLRGVLTLRADQVFSLENRDFQLKKSMEARKKEIAVHRELQRASVRAVEDERHKVALELGERESRVQKLQAKFETIAKMGGYSSEDNEPRSQAFFVIQAAQRREELQREGDELDDKIRVAEKEVRALKKALDHVDDRNSEYRKSFHRADLNGEDAVKMAALEEQVKASEDVFFKKKKELTRLEMDVESETQRLGEVETQRQFAREHVMQMETALQQVEKEVATERSKCARAAKKLEQKVAGSSQEKARVETYNLKEIGNSLLYTLGQLALEFPEISDALATAVKEHGLHIPAMPPGRVAAARAGDLPRPMSARSDKSDTRSVKSSSSNGSQRSNGSTGSSGARVAAPIKNVRIGF